MPAVDEALPTVVAPGTLEHAHAPMAATDRKAVLAAVARAGDARARAARRRRLWQLPTQAHELILAMSFTPDALRREAARKLGHIHKGHCVLKGRDVDVLYSVVHDMVTRNPLSEVFQKRLDDKHTLAVRRLGAMRDVEALQAAWSGALDDDTMPSALWALLTHPLGESLESAVLYDARAWVFAHGRRSVEMKHSQRQAENRVQEARLRADELQGRLQAQQQQAIETLGQAQAEIARLRGDLARLEQARAEAPKLSPEPPRAVTRSKAPAAEATLQIVLSAPPPLPVDPNCSSSGPSTPSVAVAEPLAVNGRRVLCVGGIQHAVARYRRRIEQLGGKFEHHDGGLEDSVHALDARLGRADVVICQAACINHEAYHRVKRHCERTGTPCVYLDRPSLSRFDRALTHARGSRDAHCGQPPHEPCLQPPAPCDSS